MKPEEKPKVAKLKLAKVAELRGVSDLPLSVRLPFARALVAAASGDMSRANRNLSDAIKAELQRKSAKG